MAPAAPRAPRLLVVGALVLGALFAVLWTWTRLGSSGPRPTAAPEALATLRQRSDVNVLFVLIDTLRADRLGCHGYPRPTSPGLDRLARDGVRFARHLAQSSWTKASMASLWTALYPSATGVLRAPDALAAEVPVAAEIFRAAGFRTAALWRNGWVAPNFGFARGFDSYTRPSPAPTPAGVRSHNPAIQLEGSDHDLVTSAVEFLRAMGRGQRWFLYLHLMDVHQYVSDIESARFGVGYSDLYDNAIHWVDRNLAALVEALRVRGLLERTLIVIASDHGEAFGEHGREGHAKDVYGEVTETPWILSLPFRLRPGIVVDAPTQNVDIWPTVLDLLGLPGLPDADGRSVLPWILDSAAPGLEAEERPGIAQLDRSWGTLSGAARPLIALTQGWHRAVFDAEPGRIELYDLREDPREQRDLASARPALAARLREACVHHLASARPRAAPARVDLDDMMLQQLRALGYRVE